MSAQDRIEDRIDEAVEQSFPASDSPQSTGVHAGVPADRRLRVLVDLAPTSADAGHFRAALARFGGQVAVTFAEGEDFARALPNAEVVVRQGLTDDELARAGRVRRL